MEVESGEKTLEGEERPSGRSDASPQLLMLNRHRPAPSLRSLSVTDKKGIPNFLGPLEVKDDLQLACTTLCGTGEFGALLSLR